MKYDLRAFTAFHERNTRCREVFYRFVDGKLRRRNSYSGFGSHETRISFDKISNDDPLQFMSIDAMEGNFRQF